MGAAHFELPEGLEALLQQVCSEQAVPERRHDELRALLTSPASTWPVCCGGSCAPCVEDVKSVAREVLARWQQR